MFSNSRDYLDSIDVEDLPADYLATLPPASRSRSHSRPMSVTSTSSASIPSLASFASTASSSQLATSPQGHVNSVIAPLHCSLFLFNDKLMIVKRQSSSVSGRKVTGLDDVQKLVKTGGGVAVMDKNSGRKDKLSFRGLVDILDVIATDVGNGGELRSTLRNLAKLTRTFNADFHLFLECPPVNQSDRWSSRPFRSYTTVHPPFALSLDPVATRKDKLRFIENLWAAQAMARATSGPNSIRSIPRTLKSDEEMGLDLAGEVFGRARCFWNVCERRFWSALPKKVSFVRKGVFTPFRRRLRFMSTKMVLHLVWAWANKAPLAW